MKKFFAFLLFLSSFLNAGDYLWIYCGVTMKKPIKEMAREFEKLHPGVKVRHLFGSSGVLFRKLMRAKRADLYLPGSPKFYKKAPELFSKKAVIGYNQLAIFTQKGNPKHIKSLEDFKRSDVRIGLGDAHSSVGKAAKDTLIRYGGEKFYNYVRKRAKIYFASPELVSALRANEVDTDLNWRAVYFWGDNRNYVELIPLPTEFAPKKPLILSVTSFSKHKDLANQFLEFASSKKGQEIMAKWGFSNSRRNHRP